MKDLRKKDITIKVREDESYIDSINRYLKGKKLTCKTIKTAGTILEDWSNEEYYRIFLVSSNYNGNTKKVTFRLDGDR